MFTSRPQPCMSHGLLRLGRLRPLTMAAEYIPTLGAQRSPEDPGPCTSYLSFQHTVVALRLRSAALTGKLGSGRAEIGQADYSALLSVLRTIPYTILLFQTAWSIAVTLIAFALADTQFSWFSVPFWTSRLSVSSSVSYGVGWALFVLLGFFIREASNRYFDAQLNWSSLGANLRQITRHIRQAYPSGTWHRADVERLVAHLVACPIALKMTLRGEKEAAQVADILHKSDIEQMLEADSMHVHCMRVVRTYISASEDDAPHSFKLLAADKTPAGWGVRYLVMDMIDAVDFNANDLVKIATSSPSRGYVTHLTVFLYLWMFFLPLALVQSSGWFTPLWAVLTSYGVGMLFTIGQALSDPFGFDMQDIKLNQLSAEAALKTLDAYSRDRLDIATVVKKDHDTPKWLEKPLSESEQGTQPASKKSFLARFVREGRTKMELADGGVSTSQSIPQSLRTDRERLFSHLVALAYGAKQDLRNNRNASVMESFLSPQDIAAFDETDDFFAHATDVVYGYLNSLDCAHAEATEIESSPLNASVYTIEYTLWALETAIQECKSIRKFPISESFTTHLKLFTFFWLALLPLSLVQFAGFLSFLYIFPISYSIINLIKIGSDLADPFGYDKEDIPLDLLCDEIRASVHALYNESLGGAADFVRPSTYSRDTFKPKAIDNSLNEDKPVNDPRSAGLVKRILLSFKTAGHDKNPTPFGSLKKMVASLPSVSVRGMALVLLWSVIAVLLSYGFSFTWDESRRNACGAWCSPIDIEVSILANIGFALFMILSFRASDAIGRYEEGAMLIFDIEMNLRNLAIEIVQCFEDGYFHENDKERIVAHIIQVPLCFRNELLTIDRSLSDEGLLSDDDGSRMLSSKSSIQYLLHTIEAYILIQDNVHRDGFEHLPNNRVSCSVAVSMISRISTIRETISRAFGVKRYPVIASYTQHQHIFAILWLLLLPLAMAPSTGFFTILWAPVISFGVLGLEELASKLVDPYGNDELDIPLNKMCSDAANSVIEGVDSVKWGAMHHTQSTPFDGDPQLGAVLQEKEVKHEHTLAHFEADGNVSLSFGEGPCLHFESPDEKKIKPHLYSHLLRSVPWWILLFVTAWTILATGISYFARDSTVVARWWKSNFIVNTTVVTYVSFAAFMVLGFFVQAAFVRYISAGGVWGARLRASCHTLAVQFQTLFPEGSIHDGDHRRILSHIAAIPLVLKSELRNSRNIQEVKGLLSHHDISKIQCADSMVSHCVDVLRSYFLVYLHHSDRLRKPVVYGSGVAFVKMEIIALEKMIRQSKFLRSFDIAPGFLILLNCFMGIWFLILPFALAEYSGWFTILWVPVIAYGVLGMYQIAKELQFPFGTDLNDLDLTAMADLIVSDIIFVEKHCKPRLETFVHSSEINSYWTEGWKEPPKKLEKQSCIPMAREFIRLALHTFSPIQTGAILLWTVVTLLIAWGVSKAFPFADEVESDCGLWFCSRIAVCDAVKEYVGFALFLLLGFRLYESHGRYVSAIQSWSHILGTTRILSNRFFESYYGDEWHKQDQERFAAHLTAFSVAMMAKLRREECVEEFRKYLSEEDTEKLLRAPDKSDYCLDVMHHYIIQSDYWRNSKEKVDPASFDEHWSIMYYIHLLKNAAIDCEEIVNIPMPFGYVQHLRIFLVIWILLLPLGLVETSGWLTILWIGFIAYGVVGIEKWSEELGNPFGYDVSDVPMNKYVEEAAQIVRWNLNVYKDGLTDIIRDDRSPFPVTAA
ncbi:unnamed protein product [Agarophyton chilense]